MKTIGEHVPNDEAFRLYERFRSHLCVETHRCAFFKRDFLAALEWQAAVVSEELSSTEIERLASACRRLGYSTAWAMDVDHFDAGFVYTTSLGSTSLSMLEETFVTPSYLVVEEEERFMLVSDSDYYWEIAGPARFLEKVFQKPLKTVHQDFLQATDSYRRGPLPIGRSLNRIAAEAMGRVLPTV